MMRMAVLSVGVFALCALTAGAQDDGPGTATTGSAGGAQTAIVELNAPHDIDATVWTARWRARASMPQTLDTAVRAVAGETEIFANVDVDELLRKTAGRQRVRLDPATNWITISLQDGPADMQAKVTNTLARWLRSEAEDEASRATESLRMQLDERAAILRARTRVAELDLRSAIERAGPSEISLELELERLVQLREDLGAMQNEAELRSLEQPDAETGEPQLAPVIAKIADVDKRLHELRRSLDEVAAIREQIEDFQDRWRDVQIDGQDLEVPLHAPRHARIIRVAASPTR
jgi:hypothetical protein